MALTKSLAKKCKNLKIRFGWGNVGSGKCPVGELFGRGSVSRGTVLQSIYTVFNCLFEIFLKDTVNILKFKTFWNLRISWYYLNTTDYVRIGVLLCLSFIDATLVLLRIRSSSKGRKLTMVFCCVVLNRLAKKFAISR